VQGWPKRGESFHVVPDWSEEFPADGLGQLVDYLIKHTTASKQIISRRSVQDQVEPFGYNMGWFAVRNADIHKISAVLRLKGIQKKSWTEGIQTVYADHISATVFVTPALKGWTFIVGMWASGTGEADSVRNIQNLIIDLSARFDEAHAYATCRAIEYHHWMMARKGHLTRAFAYLGESGEVLANAGDPTGAERTCKWDQLEEGLWSPNEETVLEVAGAWSLNPIDIQGMSAEGKGILARAPKG
jgi:hypothetical protein